MQEGHPRLLGNIQDWHSAIRGVVDWGDSHCRRVNVLASPITWSDRGRPAHEPRTLFL